MIDKHIPVLMNEVIESLVTSPHGYYVDATFGRGGHAKAILAKLSDKGRLLASDQDPSAITVAKQLQQQDSRLLIKHGSFADLGNWVQELGWFGKVSGVLLDLGVSSPQLDDATRGFSFMASGPLDMRMDTSQGLTAAQWIARVSEQELAQVLRDYGEEKFARRIAKAIVHTRDIEPITTTTQLVEIITQAQPVRDKYKHPATRSFQAIRIAINNEMDALQNCLKAVIDCLAPGGRLAVISFHSLEDRIVKQFMRQEERGEQLPRKLPVTEAQLTPGRLKRLGKAIKASPEEVAQNPRARSAILRLAERL